MIVIYDGENGEIKGTIKGNYSLERLNLSSKFIEVGQQSVEGKKVDTEKKELVKIRGAEK